MKGCSALLLFLDPCFLDEPQERCLGPDRESSLGMELIDMARALQIKNICLVSIGGVPQSRSGSGGGSGSRLAASKTQVENYLKRVACPPPLSPIAHAQTAETLKNRF
jgi:hypothetical protein